VGRTPCPRRIRKRVPAPDPRSGSYRSSRLAAAGARAAARPPPGRLCRPAFGIRPLLRSDHTDSSRAPGIP
jgi:hypothetical protein